MMDDIKKELIKINERIDILSNDCDIILNSTREILGIINLINDKYKMKLKFKSNFELEDLYPILREQIDPHFSFRTCNCLRSVDAFYIKDLLYFSEKELMGIRNFGKKCRNEIRDFFYINKMSHLTHFCYDESKYKITKV